jgi:phage-related protein
MGTNMKAAFSAGTEGTGAADAAGPMTKIASTVGQVWAKVAPAVKGYIGELLDAFKPAMPFLQNVILPLFKGVALGIGGAIFGALKIAVPLIRVLATALGFVGKVAAPFKPVIQGIGMAIGFIAGGPILRLLSFLPKLGVVFGILAAPIRIAGAMLGMVARGFGLAVRGAGLIIGAFGRVIVGVRRFLGSFAGIPRTVANLIGRAQNTIAGWAGKARSAVGRVISAIGGVLRAAPGKIVGFARTIGTKIIDAIKNVIKGAPGVIKDALLSIVPGSLRGAVSSALGLVGADATGGVVRTPLQVVGERGPELARLPLGTNVTPASRTRSLLANAAAGGGGPRRLEGVGMVPIELNVFLSGEQIHREVFRVERRQVEAR